MAPLSTSISGRLRLLGVDRVSVAGSTVAIELAGLERSAPGTRQPDGSDRRCSGRRVITDARFCAADVDQVRGVRTRESASMVFGSAVYPGLWFDPASHARWRRSSSRRCHRALAGPCVDRRQGVIALIEREDGVQRVVDRHIDGAGADLHCGGRRGASGSVVSALHVAPLITETVLSLTFATYTVSVF